MINIIAKIFRFFKTLLNVGLWPQISLVKVKGGSDGGLADHPPSLEMSQMIVGTCSTCLSIWYNVVGRIVGLIARQSVL